MYFPYFRGRQYELLALKELATEKLISENIIPVIEPIKITSALDRAVEAFGGANLPVALIYNPSVGELAGEPKAPLYKYLKCGYVTPSVLINDSVASCLSTLVAHGISKNNLLTVMDNRDFLVEYTSEFQDEEPQYTLFPDERQIRRAVKQGKVLFEDKFNKQQKNADYQRKEDEFFSEDHLYFKEEGYLGFGDYSIIGNDYSETGFAPRAVAIHIVYLAIDNTLRIQHFISDSNMDISDVAGKFYEAVSKLNTWYNNRQESQLTKGLGTLLNHYKNGTYPGLPTLKKLSIMHHLELMSRFLNRGK